MSEKKINITNEIVSTMSILMMVRYVKLNKVIINIGYNTPISNTMRHCRIISNIVMTDLKVQSDWKRIRNPLKPLN